MILSISSIIFLILNKISFPGLGIPEIEINRIAIQFTIFGKEFTIAWYGIILTTGIIVTTIYVALSGKKSKLKFDDLIDVAFFTVIFGIIGARLYYVFFDWLKNPSYYNNFIDVIAIWRGGIAIYGAIIFGAIACMITLKIKKIHIPLFFDYLAPGVMLGQIIGRWGNFVNCEAYGAETTLPWRMRLEFSYGFITEVHPTFLYESLWNLLGFILIIIFKKYRKFDGQIVLEYLAWYGFGRMFIEGLRQDSLYIGNTPIRISQIVGLVCFIVAIFFIILFYIKFRGHLSDTIYLNKTQKSAETITTEKNESCDDSNESNKIDENNGGNENGSDN